MNPVFWLLIAGGLVLLWILCAFLFKPLGKLGHRLWSDVEKAVEDKEETKSIESEKE